MLLLFVLFTLMAHVPLQLRGQGYTTWRNGNAQSVEIEARKGILLAGGGADNDAAMQWLLEQARGGDVLVLRTSGSNGYNNYLFSELGVSVNSVETIRIDQRIGANHPYVEQRIREAEVVFIAGGDQRTYYDLWRGTALERAIAYLIEEKSVTIGGTSAGAMMLGAYKYLPLNQGVTSQEALSNPFHSNMEEILKTSLFSIAGLDDLIVDTHFDERNRSGRTLAFMARMMSVEVPAVRSIAINERTAVAIDSSGTARIFGEDNRESTRAYFIQTFCNYPQGKPAQMTAGLPLLWGDSEAPACKVFSVKGDRSGSLAFDLNQWKPISNGIWQSWFVSTPGNLMSPNSDSLLCSLSSVALDASSLPDLPIRMYPNPVDSFLYLDCAEALDLQWTLFNIDGKALSRGQISCLGTVTIPAGHLVGGTYFLRIQDERGQYSIKQFKFQVAR